MDHGARTGVTGGRFSVRFGLANEIYAVKRDEVVYVIETFTID